MTISQTAQMMAILRAAYPRFYIGMTDEDAEAALNLWHGFFADDDASLVSDAVKAFIANDTKGFPPSIGQIREKLDTINQAVNGFELTPQNAWGLVKKALKDSGYHSAASRLGNQRRRRERKRACKQLSAELCRAGGTAQNHSAHAGRRSGAD